jgi:hypothetical protein
MRALFAWAVEEGLVAANPDLDVPLIKIGSTGLHCWSVEEVRHPIGTKARLALACSFGPVSVVLMSCRKGSTQEGDGQSLRNKKIGSATL